jgi:hypothetical protein
LFIRLWALGAKAVKDDPISALLDVTLDAPPLEQHQDSHGQRMTDMITFVRKISRLSIWLTYSTSANPIALPARSGCSKDCCNG